MELNYLQVFYEVAKLGKFTEAAKRLNISQSALSRSVALLEESEGVKLFERSKSGVSLTPIGGEIFRHCETLFQTVQKIDEACRGIQDSCRGPLRFTCTDHVAKYLLVQPLCSFRREFPWVIPSLYFSKPEEYIPAILNTDCEFGLSFSKHDSPQIENEALREEPMSLVVNAEVWRDNKCSTQTATLAKTLDKIGYISSISASAQKRPSRVLLELFGKMPPIGFEANAQEIQKSVCLAGGGIAYLSRFMVQEEIKKGHLHEINVRTPHQFKLWLATQKGRVLSRQAKLFLDRLRTQWKT